MKYEEYLHSRTFGVEIECYNVDKHVMHNLIAPKYLLHTLITGYNHIDYHDGKTFKLGSDGSIIGDKSCECVSPVLTYNEEGINLLKNCIKALKEVGAKVNSSCGIHVHCGVEHIRVEHYRRIFVNYSKMESVIDSFMRIDRRADNCRWAYALNPDAINRLSDIRRKNNFTSVIPNRYSKVNACSFINHKTVEFRQHSGSLCEKEILNWLSFCLNLVCWSKDHVLTDYITSIDQIPFLSDEEKKYFKCKKGYYNGLYKVNEERRNK